MTAHDYLLSGPKTGFVGQTVITFTFKPYIGTQPQVITLLKVGLVKEDEESIKQLGHDSFESYYSSQKSAKTG
jgi:hypothetical protein